MKRSLVHVFLFTLMLCWMGCGVEHPGEAEIQDTEGWLSDHHEMAEEEPGIDGSTDDGQLGEDGEGDALAPETEPNKAWLKTYTFQSERDCVKITRVKPLRRVFVWIHTKRTAATSAWSFLHYQKIKPRSSVTRCEQGSHLLRAKVKARKRSAFTIEFFNQYD